MKAVVQRAKRGTVTVDGNIIGEIEKGLVVLLGVSVKDEEKDAEYLADKIVNLRIFPDENGKMNVSLLDFGGEILSVSQFTLYGDTRKGRRPSFIEAAGPEKGEKLYHTFNKNLRNYGINVSEGVFGAMMDVELINDGPVTIIIESKF
ncbi:D-aminoacyl-tRNA deacylase [candidate division KSB1 bacterium]